MKDFPVEKLRLSDRILTALELAIEQEDLDTANTLQKALELAMTRKSGGGEFIERRDYPPHVERAMDDLEKLRKQIKKHAAE